MNAEFSTILTDIRSQFASQSLLDLDLKSITNVSSINGKRLQHYVSSDRQLAKEMLEQEKDQMVKMIDGFEESNESAIDSLLNISQELSHNYVDFIPVIARQVSYRYPELFRNHIDERIDLIRNKISVNIARGMDEGLYRSDISVELLTRLFISRFMDFYLEDPAKYNGNFFSVFFENVFESFILRIATPDGVKHYQEKTTNLSFN